jgi:isopentenyl diphosphate isomerase/L-lactate dehydrogenase-like FMN-dependent dehydrogenase
MSQDWAAEAAPQSALPQIAPDPMQWAPYDPTFLIEKPEDALDVFEFEPVAQKNVPGAHFGYLAAGADDGGGVRTNRQDIGKFAIRARRLRDVSHVDPSLDMFGAKWATPFFLCPVGAQRMYHPDGEIAVSKAAGHRNVMQALSSYADCSVAEARQARGGSPVLFQLYPQPNFEISRLIVQQAERDGSPAVLVTVDSVSARKMLTFERSRRADPRPCFTCHKVSPNDPKGVLPNFEHRPVFSQVPRDLWQANFTSQAITWEFLKRLRDVTNMKIFVKGIMSADDAVLCVKNGLDGVYISNHGGRAEDTGASTISVLQDVVTAVKGKIPIFIDGGFRRGMDIVKALAMGATAVGVGRPYIWGLGAFGEPGVAKVLDILMTEVQLAMQQVGAVTLKDLEPEMIHRAL